MEAGEGLVVVREAFIEDMKWLPIHCCWLRVDFVA